MTYIKGEARIEKDYYDTGKLAIVLPHSCDEWVIGQPEDAYNLISDLQLLAAELETKNRDKQDD